MIMTWLIFSLIFVILGCGVGMLSAMFGLGGGLIIVPMLYIYFHLYEKMPLSIEMHLALGTSMATMLVTTFNSFYNHARQRTIQWSMVKAMVGYVALGAVAATILVHWLNSEVLRVLFIILLISILLRALLKQDFTQNYQLTDFVKPKPWMTRGLSFFVGLIAVLVGIGGSVISVPFLRKHKMPMKNASGVAIALTPVVAVLGSLGYLIQGLRFQGTLPPDCFGFIQMPAFIGISIGTLIGVPYGLRIAHAVSDKALGRVYLYMLCAMILVMLF